MQFGVSESIEHWAKYRPNSPAVCSNGEQVSYREFDSLVEKIFTRICSAGSTLERIAVASSSKIRLLAAIVAVIRAGKSVVVLNTGLTDDGIRVNLLDASVSGIVCDETYARYNDLIEQDCEIFLLNDLNARADGRKGPVPNRFPQDEWGVLFSSGTTGAPKGIARDHNSIVTELIGWCLELSLSRRTIFYIGRPIYYTGGLVLALATLLVGGQIVINDLTNENDPSEVWSDYQTCCTKMDVSWAFFIPDQIRAFNRIAESLSTKLSGVNYILTMGGPISGGEKVKAKKVLQSEIVESWGNTESLGTITDPEDVDIRPNSIGRPFLTDEMVIVDEDLNVLGPNQEGRIAGGEEAGFGQYCNRPEPTSRVKKQGLIISEDIGYIDQDGYFYVRGRIQDNIVVGGESLFLPDIESKVRNLDSIVECCVVSNPKTDDDLEIVAVIATSDQERSNEQFLDEANRLLSRNEQLARLVFVERLPRLPSGKVDRIKALTLVQESR